MTDALKESFDWDFIGANLAGPRYPLRAKLRISTGLDIPQSLFKRLAEKNVRLTQPPYQLSVHGYSEEYQYTLADTRQISDLMRWVDSLRTIEGVSCLLTFEESV